MQHESLWRVESHMERLDWRLLSFFVAIASFALLGTTVYRYGSPADGLTAAALLICVLPCLVPPLLANRVSTPRSRAWYLLLLAPGLLLNLMPDAKRLHDLRGARTGCMPLPGLVFYQQGENTRRLEAALGPLEPAWRVQAIGRKALPEPVDSRGLIRSSQLEPALALLPNDDARYQVLTCLTDPRNYLRTYQGALLACLVELGTPKHHNLETWWTHHAQFFVLCYDPHDTARLTQGWSDQLRMLARSNPSALGIRRHLDAVCFLETNRGRWHPAFHAAFLRRAQLEPDPNRPRVAWWTLED